MSSFGADLRRAAATHGVTPRLIAEDPAEWRLGPLTAIIDPAAGTAQLRYARIAVARAAAEAAAVVAAWQRALAALQARSLAPDDLLPRLAAVYRDLLVAHGRRAGERIELAELRDRITRERRGYSRAQFAWDLSRLRREHRLQHGGNRIDLGVATGDAAARRSGVVWIEDDSGAGQYHRHFRLVAQEGK